MKGFPVLGLWSLRVAASVASELLRSMEVLASLRLTVYGGQCLHKNSLDFCLFTGSGWTLAVTKGFRALGLEHRDFLELSLATVPALRPVSRFLDPLHFVRMAKGSRQNLERPHWLQHAALADPLMLESVSICFATFTDDGVPPIQSPVKLFLPQASNHAWGPNWSPFPGSNNCCETLPPSKSPCRVSRH